jgi:hypothetical protein
MITYSQFVKLIIRNIPDAPLCEIEDAAQELVDKGYLEDEED